MNWSVEERICFLPMFIWLSKHINTTKEYHRGLALCQRIVESSHSLLPALHIDVAQVILTRGNWHLGLRRYEDAAKDYRRVLAVLDNIQESHLQIREQNRATIYH